MYNNAENQHSTDNNEINNKEKKIFTNRDRDVPVYYEVFDRIKEYFIANSNLGVILIDCSKINIIEQEYGNQIYEDILIRLKDIVLSMKDHMMRTDDIIAINHHEGDQIYIFLSKKRDKISYHPGSLESLSLRVSRYINEKMFDSIYPLLKKPPKIMVGYAISIHNPLIKEERLINKLIEDAKTMAVYQEFMNIMRNKEKLQEIIIKREITTIYQPVINMVTREIIGYEGLSRGPKGTEFENPYVLFNIAEEMGLLFELDSICRSLTFNNARDFDCEKLLFVNILPTTIHDPEFKGKYLQDFFNDIKIIPKCVVLEISERQVIENYDLFKMASKYYSDIGFAIAIDDAGVGHSSLERIIQLNLQYVKVDLSLVRDIDKNSLKKELVKAISQLANGIDVKIIAEGIETKEEMQTLIDLGVIYGQGFLFARPDSGYPEVNEIP